MLKVNAGLLLLLVVLACSDSDLPTHEEMDNQLSFAAGHTAQMALWVAAELCEGGAEVLREYEVVEAMERLDLSRSASRRARARSLSELENIVDDMEEQLRSAGCLKGYERRWEE